MTVWVWMAPALMPALPWSEQPRGGHGRTGDGDSISVVRVTVGLGCRRRPDGPPAFHETRRWKARWHSGLRKLWWTGYRPGYGDLPGHQDASPPLGLLRRISYVRRLVHDRRHPMPTSPNGSLPYAPRSGAPPGRARHRPYGSGPVVQAPTAPVSPDRIPWSAA